MRPGGRAARTGRRSPTRVPWTTEPVSSTCRRGADSRQRTRRAGHAKVACPALRMSALTCGNVASAVGSAAWRRGVRAGREGCPMNTSAIAVSGLRKAYGDKTVLDGIDLDVPAGTIFSLLGPNGAGKTTTVNVLTTLIKADAGTVHVAGH